LDKTIENQNYGERAMESSSTMDSTEAFEALLVQTPGDHFLVRAYADFLAGKESFALAAKNYRKAAELFGTAGLVLCAVAAKVMEWKVAKPSRRECRPLYAAIRDVRSEKPLSDFFCHMAYAELVAVMSRLDPVHLPAGAVIKHPEDEEDFLCFLVSGTVVETISPQAGEGTPVRREYSSQSAEANYFGDVYPLDEDRVSLSQFETVDACEVLRISRSQLTDLCDEHPNVQILLMRLTKAHRLYRQKEGARKFRKAVRFHLQTQVDMKIFGSDPNRGSLVLKGSVQDISLGGACISLGEKYLTGPPSEIIGKSVKVLVNVPKVEVGLNLFGTIAWCREVLREGKTIVIAGVQFKDMTQADLAFLKKHCYVGEEAQDFISYLWESQPKI
jgi:CRP-like cAMP-binding protein